MAEPVIKCKNCGAPVELNTNVRGVKPYWRHVRESHTGRIWCFPTNDIETQDYTRAAEPEE